MEYQPELGTVLDLANDSNSGKCGLCSRGSQAWLRDQASYRRPFFFSFHFCLAPQFCLGFFFFHYDVLGELPEAEALAEGRGVGSSFSFAQVGNLYL